MTKVLLDTHALLFALLDPARLSRSAAKILRDSSTLVLVSSATAWEISTKYRLGKLPGAAGIVAEYSTHLTRFRAQELAISSAHALLAGSFPQAHRDPFDRILAAQAALDALPLLTNDLAFRSFPVTIVW